MTQRTASQRGTRSRRTPAVRRTMLDLVGAMVRELFDPYRPELHYMRGPGPKWHEKHQPARTEPVAVGRLLPA
jgi:hypothetical protein